jgi:hypothetical protein
MTTECKHGPGGHRDPLVEAWEMRFSLTCRHLKLYPPSICSQLSYCRNDEARRLILGISEQMKTESQ